MDERKAHQRQQILAARRNDIVALEALMEMHREQLHHLIRKLPQDPDLYDELVLRFLEIILDDFNLDKEVLLWTFAEKVLYRHGRDFVRRIRRLRPSPEVAERLAPVPSPDHLVVLHDQFAYLQTIIRRCLQDPALAAKWIILTILYRGLDIDWKVIHTNLQQGTTWLKKKDRDKMYDWTYVHQMFRLSHDIPAIWDEVCDFLKQAPPTLSASNIPRWHARVSKKCLKHAPAVSHTVEAADSTK